MREPKYPKSTQVLDIIAGEMHMPEDASLSDILAKLFLIDDDGDVTKLLKEVIVKELLEKMLDDMK